MNDAITPLGGSTPVRKLLVSHALEYLNHLAKDAGGDQKLQRELAMAYLGIGDVSGNPSLPNLGDTPGALLSYHRATDLLEPIFRRNPRDSEVARALAEVYTHLGAVYSLTLRQGEDAMRAAEKVLAIH